MTTMFFSLQFSVQLQAQDRLTAGFTKQEAITSLSLNQDWVNKEMVQIFWPLVYDQLWLLGPAPQYKPLPGLATHWETDDYKTWRFYLNQQASFSDQIPVLAEDVVFSLNLFTKRVVGWNVRNLIIESYHIPDRHVLIVTLHEPHSGPYPPFYRIPILPRHFWKKYEQRPEQFANQKAVGSGAYVLKEFKAGELVRLERNRRHQGNVAKYQELVLKVFPTPNDLLTALRSGTIEMFGYQGIAPSQVRELEQVGTVRLVTADDLKFYWLAFNLAHTAIADLTVRRAILMAIDKSEIISQVFSGYAKAIDSFIYPELPDYNSGSGKLLFDPKTAAALLTQAGYRDLNGDGLRDDPILRQNLSLTFLVPALDPQAIQIAELLKKQLAKSGIALELVQAESFLFDNSMRMPVTSEFAIALNSARPGPYQDWIWNLMSSAEDQFNRINNSGYTNEAFDRLFQKMLTTTETDRKSKYLVLMQKILTDDLPYGPLIRPVKICPLPAKLNDVVVTMGGVSSEINLWNYLKPAGEQQ